MQRVSSPYHTESRQLQTLPPFEPSSVSNLFEVVYLAIQRISHLLSENGREEMHIRIASQGLHFYKDPVEVFFVQQSHFGVR